MMRIQSMQTAKMTELLNIESTNMSLSKRLDVGLLDQSTWPSTSLVESMQSKNSQKLDFANARSQTCSDVLQTELRVKLHLDEDLTCRYHDRRNRHLQLRRVLLI